MLVGDELPWRSVALLLRISLHLASLRTRQRFPSTPLDFALGAHRL
jgi:hypothetical protein